MSSYNESIKNFERVRAYMRDFYVYGFKSREEYCAKSARSYDDERRRMESWLGDHMSFVRTSEGKTMFISIDSRESIRNPLYKAWKSKSFTDGDITLHFIVFDILNSSDVSLSLPEILRKIDGEYLSCFDSPITFDESTVRKKLKEYESLGLISSEKQGRKILYRRAPDIAIDGMSDALNYFSEVLPCGVIGSFLLDKLSDRESAFGFKHHYITSALYSDVLALLFYAMQSKSFVTVKKINSRTNNMSDSVELVPLRVFISAQSGRQHILAYQPRYGKIKAFRIDYCSEVKIGAVCPHFDEYRALLDEKQKYMWGVTCKSGDYSERTERVEFVLRINPGEEHIIRRLEREKRNGTVEKIDDCRYRFSATVFDSGELKPWIRTFICRIERLNFSNRTVENEFKRDIQEMCRLYDIDGGDRE